jgi:hypothetical protein
LRLSAFWVVLAVACHLPVSEGHARTWIVYPDGTGDAPTIAAALDSAAVRDSVKLMPGTYYEHSLDLPDSVFIFGLDPETTVIDAQGRGRVMSFTFSNGPLAICRVYSVTLTGGKADMGGAVYVEVPEFVSWGLFLRNVIITGNEATDLGGGICCMRGDVDVRYSEIRGNRSLSMGGGVYCSRGNVDVRYSEIRGNQALSKGGAAAADWLGDVKMVWGDQYVVDNTAAVGGAFWVGSTGDIRVGGLVLAGNEASIRGGVVAQEEHGHCSIRVSTIVDNTAPEGAVWHNTADRGGGLELCIVAFNGCNGPCLVCESGLNIVGDCNDFYGNVGPMGCLIGGEVINADPLFCDFESGDYTLREDSPCLEENYPDSLDCGGSMGTFPEPGCSAPVGVRRETWGRIKTLYQR